MNKAQAWRRWFGLAFLGLAFGMLVWGQTVLEPKLDGVAYLLYWMGCFVFTFLALLTALLDIWCVRRKQREDRRALIKNTFSSTDQLDDDDSNDKSTSTAN